MQTRSTNNINTNYEGRKVILWESGLYTGTVIKRSAGIGRPSYEVKYEKPKSALIADAHENTHHSAAEIKTMLLPLGIQIGGDFYNSTRWIATKILYKEISKLLIEDRTRNQERNWGAVLMIQTFFGYPKEVIEQLISTFPLGQVKN